MIAALGPLLVYGHVTCGSVGRRSGTDNNYQFKIQALPYQADVALEVRRAGLVPAGFSEGKLVIVRGKLAADGVLDVADGGITVNSCAYNPPLRCDS